VVTKAKKGGWRKPTMFSSLPDSNFNRGHRLALQALKHELSSIAFCYAASSDSLAICPSSAFTLTSC